MSTTVRAKFKCTSARKHPMSDGEEQAEVYFSAVTDDNPENASWSKYTPCGDLHMTIGNAALVDHFVDGKEYYLDISLVSEE